MNFAQQHKLYQAGCEDKLEEVVARYFTKGSQVSSAAAYALLGGGKRVRGVMVQAVCDLLGGSAAAALAFAAAMEMVHAFSLVHDDLPCMDDDDFRRGKPSTHVAFGEANALLAGDMLLAEAFSVLADAECSEAQRILAVKLLGRATGAAGMIYGQELDLAYEDAAASAEVLQTIHTHKTGALFTCAVRLGQLAAGSAPGSAAALEEYAKNVGLVFQIVDDILDVTSTTEALGKPVGSDAENAKNTFVTLHGIPGARKEVQRLTGQAVAGLQASYGDKAWFLTEYANQLAARVK
ncbi:polyprenyl synthetase family protein [Ruminococcaceae bacterium OttesenSCG-928-O06]|nr:polyprenyl synthetase family protein [Ruminococcaceae bacterium OttesenSCG-928-O06]